jgi:glycolate oxidase iron-sulfur subunit
LALGEEMDSPRGRIFLMKDVLEGHVPLEQAVPYIDRCLGCVACETACPSGVPYGHLITPFRAYAEQRRRRSLFDRMLRWFVLSLLPYPTRFRWAARMGQLSRPLAILMPRRMRSMLDLLPATLPKANPLPEIIPAEGTRRARVALLAGCAQQVLEPDINWATARVLARNGVEVVVPRQQVCCGALPAHTGALAFAKRLARKNLRAFPMDVDAIVTNAAGCGSGMHEYALWLEGDAEESAARDFIKKVRDVSVVLDDLGFIAPPPLKSQLVVAYHDACHLLHAQQVRSAPRSLLRKVEGLQLCDVPSGEICCGSAGTYNLEQPEIAKQLGQMKADSILETKADVVATGNIGCMTQIATHLQARGKSIPVLHTMQLLDRAYRGERIK